MYICPFLVKFLFFCNVKFLMPLYFDKPLSKVNCYFSLSHFFQFYYFVVIHSENCNIFGTNHIWIIVRTTMGSSHCQGVASCLSKQFSENCELYGIVYSWRTDLHLVEATFTEFNYVGVKPLSEICKPLPGSCIILMQALFKELQYFDRCKPLS